MNKYRKNAITAGVLLLVATAAGVSGMFSLQFIKEPDYLAEVSKNILLVNTGAILILIMSFACAGVAIWLYPVLKEHNKSLAFGAAGFRIIEAVFHTISILGIIPLISLSKEYIAAGATDISCFQTIGSVLQSVHDTAGNIGLIAWCTGATMYYYVFYRSKLIPRWLSVWGLVAVIPAFFAIFSDIYGLLDPESGMHTLLNFPIALQEMILAAWLIIKGFHSSAISESSVQ